MMDNREDITNPFRKRIAEFEKETGKLKRLKKSSDTPNNCENKEKQHPQDDSLPSTSKSTSTEAIALPSTSCMEVSNISTTTLDEIVTGTDNSGKTYSGKIQHKKNRNQFSVYKKRGGTVNLGREYEYLMCAYYALKLCFDENVVDFEITTNNEDYGDFDDVVLKVTFADNLSKHFLMQLKHMEKEQEITNNMFSTKKGDFNLLKYFKSFQNLQDRNNVICIVFTNRKYQLNDKPEFKLEDECIIVSQCQPHNINYQLIDTASGDNTAHIFNFKQKEQKSQNFGHFFKSFYLFTNQKNCFNLQSHIDNLLYERFGGKVDFVGFMSQWWKGNFVLHKHDVIVKLAELALSPFIQEIPKNINEPLSDKAKLLKEAIMQFEMTLVKDCDNANAVAKIWMGGTDDLEMISKASLKYGLSPTGLKDKDDLASKEFTKVLWFLNKIPLIVKYDEKEEKGIRAAIDLLAMETDKKNLVLVGEKPKETISKGIVLKSLYDLRDTPFYNQIITKFKVSLQERQSINLEKFINSDTETAKLIEIKDLFLMLEKDLNIGKPLPKLPAAYIPRTLKHHNSSAFEDKAFAAFNNPVNIVIGIPGIGKSTLMTYLSHQCPPDHWCVRVNLIEFGNFFSEKHSTEAIMDKFLKDENIFFDKVKATFRKNKKIYLLLDGLDEIGAQCVETVLEFIKDISSNGIRVWISSREHLKDTVSSYFKISPITIEELTKENQEKYIEQRLCYCDKSENDEGVNYTEDEANEIITRLFTSVNVAYNAKNILGVPLLLFIITEIFRNNKSNFEKIIREDIFVLTKMYKIFFQGKEEHQHKKAGVQNKRALGNRLNYQLKQYELVALETSVSEILPNLKLDSKKVNKSQEFLEEIRNEGDPLGIISRVVGETNKLEAIFSHQSFAEYFACVWLKKNKEKLGLIKDWFFDSYSDNLRLIFDIMLAEDKPHHLAVLYENPDQVKKYINQYEDRDEGGRTALHLISSYSDDDRVSNYTNLFSFTSRDLTIYQILLKKCNPVERDELFKWNCLDYALRRNSLLLFEVILETKLNEEMIDINGLIEYFGGFDKFIGSSCLYGYFHLLKTLIDRKFVENIMDVKVKLEFGFITRKVTPLHLASPNGNRDVVELLLRKGYKVNVVDEKKCTPLHFACRWGTYDAVINILELGGDLSAVTDKKQTPLHLASKSGNTDIIELLLQKGCKVNVADKNNYTPLHIACNYGRYDVVIKILELGGDLNAVTNDKQTPLHLASENGNTDIIELLFRKEFKINMTDKDNCTPLHVACKYGRYDAVIKILEHGGDLNAVTNEKQTPLHIALKNGYTDISGLLLEERCKVNVADKNNWSPLHVACNYKRYDAVIKILERGGDLNAVTNEKQTPLHLASKSGNTDIIELLLEKECKVNATDKDNCTPLHVACNYERYDAVIKILEHGGDLNAVTNEKQTPLHLASANGNTDIIELLFRKECKINMTDKDNCTPLHVACNHRRCDAVLKILELGGDLNAITNEKQTALHIALEKGYTDISELLLKKGCKVNATDKDNCTPLHVACNYERYNAVIKILEHGGDLNAVTNEKQTPLHIVSKIGNTSIIELFLENGCKVNATDKDNCTPLHVACNYGRYNAVIKILEGGGDLNAITNEKQTPLHMASKSGNTNIIELLLGKGCKVNATDKDNCTPLHVACNYGRYDAVIRILELGGDLNAVTDEKQTPLHMASKSNNTNIIELLLEKGCKVNATDKDNCTPLHVACNYGRCNAVIKILKLGGDLNAVTNEKQTPLHLASKNTKSSEWERKKIVKYLLENGININALDDKSRTPLRCACDEKNYAVIKALLKNDAHLDAECRNILSQIFCDILCRGKIRLIEILLQRLTNIEINNALSYFPSEFPIYLATRDGHLQSDLLLKMAKLIERYISEHFVNTNSSEYIKLLIEYLIKNFAMTEESSPSTSC